MTQILFAPAKADGTNKRQAAKAASRQALVSAATELMPAKGIDVSLDEICAKAGYTRGALYQHFPTRGSLLFAVITAQGEQTLTAMVKRFACLTEVSLDGFLQTLVDVLQTGQYPIGRTGFLKSHQLMEACERYPAVADLYHHLLAQMRDLFEQTIETIKARGGLKPGVITRDLATMVLGLLAGMRTLHELEAPLDFSALPALLSAFSA